MSDIWRCLEICVDAKVFSRGVTAESATIVRELFNRQNGRGMRALTDQQLSHDTAAHPCTLIRALITRLRPSA